MSDPKNTKTIRKIQCRDYLYDVFVDLSTELNCSVDYLINEAMREYLRARGVAVARADEEKTEQTSEFAEEVTDGGMTDDTFVDDDPATEDDILIEAPSIVPDRGLSAPPSPEITVDADVGDGASAPPPLPGRASVPAQDGGKPELYMIFNDEKRRIEKDEFIIGRGTKSSDLAIRDGNISRRHAAVVFQEGAYYIKDLGSTNGINFGERRVESKRIEEGDVYRLCDYEIRFTYQ